MALGQLVLLGWGLEKGSQIVSGDPRNIHLPLSARVILSTSLVVAALLIALSLRSTAAYFILLGMILSFLGDMFNAGVISLPVPLIGGMSAFGAAHCLYIFAFFILVKETGALFSAYFWIVLAAVWLVTAICWRLFIYNPEKMHALNAGSLIYAFLIGAMTSFTFAVGLELGGWWWTILPGALLFYLSDTIIGITDIGRVALKRPHLWIWLTYVLGQMGIIYGVWLGFSM